MTLNIASGMGLFSLEQSEEREVSLWVSEDVNMASFRAGDVTPGEPSHMCRHSSGTPGKHGHTRVFCHVQKVPRLIDPRANQVYEMRN